MRDAQPTYASHSVYEEKMKNCVGGVRDCGGGERVRDCGGGEGVRDCGGGGGRG